MQLARIDVLVLHDWGMGPVDTDLRGDLLEIIDDRATRRGTFITHQLPVEHYHGWIGDPTITDAIRDRLLHNVHHFTLDGRPRRAGTCPGTAASTARAACADRTDVSP